MHKTAAARVPRRSSLASADVLDGEFEFTPYTGDLKEDHVETVAGKGQVFTNNVLIADRDIRKEMVPVLRKGRNSIRIEFQPSDGKAPYHGRRARSSLTLRRSTGRSKANCVDKAYAAGVRVTAPPFEHFDCIWHSFARRLVLRKWSTDSTE